MMTNVSGPDRSDETARVCPLCESALSQYHPTGNLECENPQCGFRSIKVP
ncbi:hypothetical protein [Natronobiforma cellulositropha]|nr:hypothetical protein [Natronobiforma cellulositropha]